MKDEHSPQSEVRSALDVSIHCRIIHLSIYPNFFRSSCCWKTSPQHDTATTMLHCGQRWLFRHYWWNSVSPSLLDSCFPDNWWMTDNFKKKKWRTKQCRRWGFICQSNLLWVANLWCRYTDSKCTPFTILITLNFSSVLLLMDWW